MFYCPSYKSADCFLQTPNFKSSRFIAPILSCKDVCQKELFRYFTKSFFNWKHLICIEVFNKCTNHKNCTFYGTLEEEKAVQQIDYSFIFRYSTIFFRRFHNNELGFFGDFLKQ